MRIIFKSLAACLLFVSCETKNRKENSMESRIDSEISERLEIYKKRSIIEDSINQISTNNLLEIDKECKDLIHSISSFDSAVNPATKADSCFEKQAELIGVNKSKFVTVGSIEYKDEMVMAIKFNELILLDHLLLNTTYK